MEKAIPVKYFITSPSGAFNLRQPINKLHAIMCLGVISTNVYNPPSRMYNIRAVCTLFCMVVYTHTPTLYHRYTRDVYKTDKNPKLIY